MTNGVSTTVADARFAKPLDHELIARLAARHQLIVTIEEGSIGGFGSFVQQHMLQEGLLDSGRVRLRAMCLPDRFIEHGTPAGQYLEAGLDEAEIVALVERTLGQGRRVRSTVRVGAA